MILLVKEPKFFKTANGWNNSFKKYFDNKLPHQLKIIKDHFCLNVYKLEKCVIVYIKMNSDVTVTKYCWFNFKKLSNLVALKF